MFVLALSTVGVLTGKVGVAVSSLPLLSETVLVSFNTHGYSNVRLAHRASRFAIALRQCRIAIRQSEQNK